MTKSILFLIILIIFLILTVLFIKQGIKCFSADAQVLGYVNLFAAMAVIICSLWAGYDYYDSQKQDFCTTRHYEYQANEKYDYYPQYGTKLKNICDNCGKTLSDNDFNLCPYCGNEIEIKIGEIPVKNNKE